MIVYNVLNPNYLQEIDLKLMEKENSRPKEVKEIRAQVTGVKYASYHLLVFNILFVQSDILSFFITF